VIAKITYVFFISILAETIVTVAEDAGPVSTGASLSQVLKRGVSFVGTT
jgi:hypothetical protein